MKPLKNLGTRNGWKRIPPELEKCDHPKDYSYPYGRYRGYTVITCKKCGFQYSIDSTD